MNKYILAIIVALGLFLIACEKDVLVSRVPDEFPTGSLVIDSYPPNTSIFIDGNNTGYITPDTIDLLEIREHTVTLKTELWLDYEYQVTPVENQNYEHFADFRTLPGVEGNISINPNFAGIKVQINNAAEVLTTPAVKRGLYPGYYKVKAFRDEHRPDSTILTVYSGETSVWNFNLEDTSKWVSYTTENSSLQSDIVNQIAVDQSGIKWLATSKGLIKFNGREFIVYNKDNSPLPGNAVSSLIVDNSNNLWIGTATGLAKYDGNNWVTFESDANGVMSNQILCMALGPDNKIWIGTASNGVYSFDGVDWRHFTTSNSGLHVNYITAIAVNKFNQVLAGTSNNWLAMYSGGFWRIVSDSFEMRLPSPKISAIAADQQGRFWIGHMPTQTEPGGLIIFNGSETWEVNLVGYSKEIKHIFIDTNGSKWASTPAGIIRVNENDMPSSITDMHSLSISSVAKENETVYWISTSAKGIAKLKLQ